jgi:hypothetical protein
MLQLPRRPCTPTKLVSWSSSCEAGGSGGRETEKGGSWYEVAMCCSAWTPTLSQSQPGPTTAGRGMRTCRDHHVRHKTPGNACEPHLRAPLPSVCGCAAVGSGQHGVFLNLAAVGPGGRDRDRGHRVTVRGVHGTRKPHGACSLRGWRAVAFLGPAVIERERMQRSCRRGRYLAGVAFSGKGVTFLWAQPFLDPRLKKIKK